MLATSDPTPTHGDGKPVRITDAAEQIVAPIGAQVEAATATVGWVEDAAAVAWPRALGMRSLLGAALFCVLIGVHAVTLDDAAVTVIVPSSIVAIMVMRLTFEAVALRVSLEHLGARLVATVPAVVLGGVLTAGAAWGSGTATTFIPLGVAGGLSALILAAAPELRQLELRRRAERRRVFFFGTFEQGFELSRELSRLGGSQLVGTATIGDTDVVDPEALLDRLQTLRPSMLVMSDEALRRPGFVRVASRLHRRGVRVRDLRAFYEQEFRKVALSELSTTWFLCDIAEIHAARVYGTAKRAVELLLATCGLLAATPLFPLVAIGIRFCSPGPILFRQPRVGKDGQVFTLLKFRSMHTDAAVEMGHWADASAGRVFPLGRFMRTFRIDELPQLWNIVRGELSLVGPRPEQPSIVASLASDIRFYEERYSLRPGLTGWAQINAGYAGSREGSIVKLQYDLYYLKHQSLKIDLKIVLATLGAMLRGSGR